MSDGKDKPLVYVLLTDIADDGEEPFDRDKFEGVFSSLREVEKYIRECINEDEVSLQWEPMVTFEHTPYLQAERYIVHVATVDEGTWRSLTKTIIDAPLDLEGNPDRATTEEVNRLAVYFATALSITPEEFDRLYS